MTNFDIFGSNPTTQQPTEVQPVVNPVSEVQPVVEPIPQSVPSTSEFITMPQMTNFDIFGGNAPMPQQTNEVQPMVNPVPEVQPVKQDLENIPPIGPGLPGYVAPEESMVESQIPVTVPIIESPIVDKSTEMTQQSESLFSFGNMNSLETTNEVKPEPATIEEIKIPDPIIVTDYSKQYDPIMPQLEPLAPTIDFKEVISAIRECSNKIEQYGFKIDVEEYDLANLYQVIFKIEK